METFSTSVENTLKQLKIVQNQSGKDVVVNRSVSNLSNYTFIQHIRCYAEINKAYVVNKS